MKNKFFLSICLLLIGMIVHAQQGIGYKAVITNNGNVLSSQSVTLRFTILQGGTTAVYQEQQTTTTDVNGIVIANIGEGTPISGTFVGVNWGFTQSLKVEVNSGSGYVDMGTTAMRFVPYAKIAAKALDANDHDFYKTAGSNKATSNSDDIYHMGKVGIGTITYDAQLEVATSTNTTTLRTSNSANSSLENIGIQSQITNTGTGIGVGASTILSGSGSGIQYGAFNMNSNSGNGLHYGVRNMMYGTGSGIHNGTYNELFGTGTGDQIGSYQYIYNSNNATHYGISNLLAGSGSGDHFGIKNVFTGSGNGATYGEYNVLSSTGTGFQFGSSQTIYASGNGDHYGFYSYLPGTGSGNKYGAYLTIPSTAGGYHMALYAKATKAGSWAGYFVGNTYFEGKLTSPVSGDADMKAYVYGNVNSNGSVSNGCSSGFTCSKPGVGTYRITFTTSMGNGSAYVVVGNILDSASPKVLTYSPSVDYVDIFTWNLSGTLVDAFFNFVVYKK